MTRLDIRALSLSVGRGASGLDSAGRRAAVPGGVRSQRVVVHGESPLGGMTPKPTAILSDCPQRPSLRAASGGARVPVACARKTVLRLGAWPRMSRATGRTNAALAPALRSVRSPGPPTGSASAGVRERRTTAITSTMYRAPSRRRPTPQDQTHTRARSAEMWPALSLSRVKHGVRSQGCAGRRREPRSPSTAEGAHCSSALERTRRMAMGPPSEGYLRRTTDAVRSQRGASQRLPWVGDMSPSADYLLVRNSAALRRAAFR